MNLKKWIKNLKMKHKVVFFSLAGVLVITITASAIILTNNNNIKNKDDMAIESSNFQPSITPSPEVIAVKTPEPTQIASTPAPTPEATPVPTQTPVATPKATATPKPTVKPTPVPTVAATPPPAATPVVATNTFGNTSGNIINGGTSAFDGEFIYYTNSSDGGKVYKERPDGSENSIVSDISGYGINVVGDWVYFAGGVNNSGIYKVKKDGSNKTKISSDMVDSLNVINDWIYYSGISGGSQGLYKIKTDGLNKTKVNFGDSRFTLFDDPDFTVQGEWLYINLFNSEAHTTQLCRVKIDGSAAVNLLDHSSHHFAVSNGWIYFLSKDYKEIRKMKVDGSNNTLIYKVSDYSIYSINISGNNIYYSTDNQSADAKYGGIYKINMDGSGLARLTNTWCKHFTISGGWIYYEGGKTKAQ